MAKNIVVFSDGTGQEGGDGFNTNVYKLFNMVEDRTPRQIAFYDRGLGTGWRKATGQGAGMGISKNIRECYEFIFENYEDGDHVYLFGFSRGAFTVRSLSGFIYLIGILPKSRPELIKKAYKIYRTRDPKKRQAKTDLFLAQHRTLECDVRFIGVWDTVAALGVPLKVIDLVIDRIPFWRHSFHDSTLCPNVDYAYHALSIDDQRLTFHPTLWDESKACPHQQVEQTWFAGVHTDVGGGYEKRGLADVTLDWMLSRAKSAGLLLWNKHRVTLKPNPAGALHDSRQGLLGKLYRHSVRSIEKITEKARTKMRIHESVFQRTANPNCKYNPQNLPPDPKKYSVR